MNTQSNYRILPQDLNNGDIRYELYSEEHYKMGDKADITFTLPSKGHLTDLEVAVSKNFKGAITSDGNVLDTEGNLVGYIKNSIFHGIGEVFDLKDLMEDPDFNQTTNKD